MEPIELANKYLIDYKERNGEIIAKQCPFCKPTKKDNLYKFYMSKETGAFKCYRENNCGETGSFYDLLEHFGENKNNKTKYKKTYKKPKSTTIDVRTKVEKYLQRRQISKKTWKALSVKEKNDNLAFEYYQDSELVLIKYRNRKKGDKKRYWQDGGGKPVLWNIDKIDTDKPLVITEGELDSLAVYETGYKNVVSVPFGTNNFEWVKYCWDKLNQIDEIIIWADNDQAGLKMRDEAIKRLGKYKCKYVECEYKDINKLLYKEGKQAVLDRIENAKEIPITQLKQLHEIEVFDPSDIPKVKSNISLVNKYFGGYLEGMITIWTGANASGKSTFLNQQIIEAIDQKKPSLIVSGELTNSMLRYWIELQAAGKDNIKSRWDNVREQSSYYVPSKIKNKIRNWTKNKLFIYDSLDNLKPSQILEVFKGVRKRYNVKNFVVDNLMVLNYSGSKTEKYNKQAKFVRDCKEFSKEYDTHIHIVAHPRKPNGVVTKEDVAGLYEITNFADNVAGITRVTPKTKNKLPGDLVGVDNVLQIMKCRLYGNQDINIKLIFDEPSKRFCQLGDENNLNKQYGWDKKQQKYRGYDENAGF